MKNRKEKKMANKNIGNMTKNITTLADNITQLQNNVGVLTGAVDNCLVSCLLYTSDAADEL